VSPAPEPGLMPIGRLARLSRLSVKALRLYDAEGLLAPAWVDPDSGYRYYRADQVATAATIALLRSLDVPLAAVRRVLAAPDDAALAAVLEGERERAARDLAAREQALRSIARLARSPAAVRYDVAIEREGGRRLVGLEGAVRATHLDEDTGALCGRFAGFAAHAGLSLAAPFCALFPLDLEDELTATAGLLLDPAAPVPAGAVEVALPAGAWASTLHAGAYAELALAYRALFEHLAERGLVPVAPVVETYLNDPAQVPAAELVTRLSVRVAGEAAPAG